MLGSQNTTGARTSKAMLGYWITFFDKSYVAFLFRLIKISRLDLNDHEKLFKAIQINPRIAWYI